MAQQGAQSSIILEEAIHEDFEPTVEEIEEYAKWLGIDIEKHPDLMWIAESGIKASLPSGWMPCQTGDSGDIFYFNSVTGESMWDHPCDKHHRELLKEEMEKKLKQQEDDALDSSASLSTSLDAGDQDGKVKKAKSQKEKKAKKEKKIKISGMSAPRSLAPLGRLGGAFGKRSSDGEGEQPTGAVSGAPGESGARNGDEDEDEDVDEEASSPRHSRSAGQASAWEAGHRGGECSDEADVGRSKRSDGTDGRSSADGEGTEAGNKKLDPIVEEESTGESVTKSQSQFQEDLDFEKKAAALAAEQKTKLAKLRRDLEDEFEVQRDLNFGELQKKQDRELRELKQQLQQDAELRREALRGDFLDAAADPDVLRRCEAARLELAAVLGANLEELCELPERKRHRLLVDSRVQRLAIHAGAVAEMEALLGHKPAAVLQLSQKAFDAARASASGKASFEKATKEVERPTLTEALLARDHLGNVPLHYCRDVSLAELMSRASPLARNVRNLRRQRPIHCIIGRVPADPAVLALVASTSHLLEPDDRGVSAAMLTQGAARTKVHELVSSWEALEAALARPVTEMAEALKNLKPPGEPANLLGFHLFGEEEVWRAGRLTPCASKRLSTVYEAIERILDSALDGASDASLSDLALILLTATKGPRTLALDPRGPFRVPLLEKAIDIDGKFNEELDTCFEKLVKEDPSGHMEWIVEQPHDTAAGYSESRWPHLDLEPRPRWGLASPGWLLDSEPDLRTIFQSLQDVNALSTTPRDFVYEMMRISSSFGKGQSTETTDNETWWYAAWLQGLCQQNQNIMFNGIKNAVAPVECVKCPVKSGSEYYEAVQELANEFGELDVLSGRAGDKERELTALKWNAANFICGLQSFNVLESTPLGLKRVLSQIRTSQKLKVIGSRNGFKPAAENTFQSQFLFKVWVECEVADKGPLCAEVCLQMRSLLTGRRIRAVLQDFYQGRMDWPHLRPATLAEAHACRAKAESRQLMFKLSENPLSREELQKLIAERDALHIELESSKKSIEDKEEACSDDDVKKLKAMLEEKTKEVADVQANAALTAQRLQQFEQKMAVLAERAQELERVQRELDESKRECARLEDENHQVKCELKQTKLDGAAALQMFENQSKDEKEEKMNSSTSELQRLRDEHKTAIADAASAKEEVSSMRAELERLRSVSSPTAKSIIQLQEEQNAARLARAEAAKLTHERQEAVNKLEEKQAEVAELTRKCAELSAKLQGAPAQSNGADDGAVAAAQAAVLVAEAERDAYKKECDRLRTEGAGVGAAAVEATSVRLRTAEAELTAAQARIDGFRSEAAQHSLDAKTSKADAERLKVELGALRAAHADKESECRRLTEGATKAVSAASDVVAIKAAHGQLEEKLRVAVARQAELESQARTTGSHLASARAEVEAKAREIERLQSDAMALGSRREEAQSLHGQLAQERDTAKSEYTATMLELSNVKSSLEARSAECDRLQARHADAVKSLNDDLQRAQQELVHERSTASNARSEHSSSSREIIGLRADLEAKGLECKRLQDKLAGSAGVTLDEFRRLQDQMEEESRAAAKAHADAGHSTRELAALRPELDARVSENAKLRSEIGAARHKADEARCLQSQLEDLQAALAKARADAMTSQLELTALRAEVEAKGSQLTRALAEKAASASSPPSPEISAAQVRMQTMVKEEQKAASQARLELEEMQGKLDSAHQTTSQLRREAADAHQNCKEQVLVQQREAQGKLRCLEAQLDEEQAKNAQLQSHTASASAKADTEIASLRSELELRASECGRLRADLLQYQEDGVHSGGDAKVVANLRAQVSEFRAQVDRLKQQATSTVSASPEETQYLRASIKDRDDVILELKAEAAQAMAKNGRLVDELQTKLAEARAKEKRRQLEDSSERSSDFQNQLRCQASEIERLYSEARLSAGEAERLKCEVRAAAKKVAVAEEAHASAMEHRHREVERLEDALRERDGELCKMKDQLDRSRSGMVRLESDEQRASKKLTATKAELDHSRQETQRLLDQLHELERGLEDMRAACRAEQTARGQIDGQLREGHRENRMLREKVQQHQAETETVREEARRYRGEIADRDLEVARIQKQLEHLEATERDVRMRVDGSPTRQVLHNSWVHTDRERKLAKREQGLKDREQAILEAEVLLRERRRKDASDDLSRSCAVGISATPAVTDKDAAGPGELLEVTMPEAANGAENGSQGRGSPDRLASTLEGEARGSGAVGAPNLLAGQPSAGAPWLEGGYADTDLLGRDVEDSIGSRAIAEAAATLESRRRYLRRERVELEELRRRWRADMQQHRAVGGSQQTSILLREVRTCLDQRASALNRSINEQRTLERDLMLAQVGSSRQRSKTPLLEADMPTEVSSLGHGDLGGHRNSSTRARTARVGGVWADPTDDLALVERWQRFLGPDIGAGVGNMSVATIGARPTVFAALDEQGLLRNTFDPVSMRPLTARSHRTR